MAKDAKLCNGIVFQGSEIAKNADVSYVVIDKNVVISPARVLAGFESYPAFISKGSVV